MHMCVYVYVHVYVGSACLQHGHGFAVSSAALAMRQGVMTTNECLAAELYVAQEATNCRPNGPPQSPLQPVMPWDSDAEPLRVKRTRAAACHAHARRMPQRYWRRSAPNLHLSLCH